MAITQKDIVFLTNNQRTRYATLASMILLVYDHAISLRSEVDLVWYKGWTWSKVLFLWNRYGTFVILLFDTIVAVGGGPSDTFCLHWQKFQGWTGWLTNMTVEIIIQVRIAAMFSQDKRVIIPVVILFFAQAIGMAVIIGAGFEKMKALHEPVPGFRVCALDRVPDKMYIYWATNLAFETILFGLALFKASQHVARKQGLRPDWSGPRILNILVRDSILYFFVIFITYVTNLVSWSTGGGGLYQLAISLAISLRASMGSRLLLNIREAYYGCEVIATENALSTIQWQQRGTDCVVMDSFRDDSHRQESTAFSTLPDLDRECAPEQPQAGPSSSSQIKSRSKVTFETPYTP